MTVKTVTFTDTTNGVRIKTWGRPSNGFVKGVVFQHLLMDNVQNPIIIDQNYCPNNNNCPDQVCILENIKFSTSILIVRRVNYLMKTNYLFFNFWQNSGLKISDVTYQDIHGTSGTRVAVKFDCSKKNPCSGIRLEEVNLSYKDQPAEASCANAGGTSTGVVKPSSCL